MTEFDIAVIGASGRLGRKVVERLSARGLRVVAIGRSHERMQDLPQEVAVRIADCQDAEALGNALAGCPRVASCVHARFAKAILAVLAPEVERLVLVGSTRIFTRFPDQPAREVRAAEEALMRSGRNGVILHPTMIYGADGENNVQRIATLIRRFGIIPLPLGGRCLIQPIYIDDVADCVVVATLSDQAIAPSFIIAGPTAVTLADFIRAIAAAAGRPVRVLSVPVTLLYLASLLLRLVPKSPRIGRAEVRRLLENKDFPIDDMRRNVGIEPQSLAEGLAKMFRSPPC